tara:strand:+ start:5258 stop:6541 length:1284 start_codon:yes stop_codon:yes gene_type:complete
LKTHTRYFNQKVTPKACIIFFLSALFYLYEFVLQVAPSVMAKSMMQTFHVSAAGFGAISACYFYAYAPMQLPAGLLFDRFGPRKLISIALCICAFGTLFFASTNSIFTAALGRFLIGGGSAFSFIGILVLISRWFPARYFALLAGTAQLMSSIGAMFGEMPLAILIKRLGWREANFVLFGIGLILAILLWLFIRDFPEGMPKINTPKRSFKEEWRRLMTVCQNFHTWAIGLYACAIWTPIAVFAALWGVPYLQQKYMINLITASSLCSMIWLGIGLGSPLLGWFSDKLCLRRLALALSAILGLVSTLMILYVPGISITQMYIILFIFGLGAGGQTLSFAVVKDNNLPEFVGTASGFNNLAVLIGGAIFQPIIGIILRNSEKVTSLTGISAYSLSSYNKALVIMPSCYALSLLLVLFLINESHPEKKY